MSRFLLLGFIFSITLVACGPATSARDAEEQQEQAAIKEARAANDPMQGRYEGTMTNNTGQVQKEWLQVISTANLQYVPAENKLVEVPTLIGYLGGIGGGDASVQGFNLGVYDQTTGHLELWATTALANAANGSSVSLSGIDLQVSGSHLYGRYFSQYGYVANDLDLHRVTPPAPTPTPTPTPTPSSDPTKAPCSKKGKKC